MPDHDPSESLRLRPDTVAVTAGRPRREPDAPLNQPPVFASTYVGAPTDQPGVRGYGRYGNPTWSALEEAVGALEGGRAIAYGSGMAAVHAVLELVPAGGVLVIPRHFYLGVAAVADRRAARDAVEVRRVDVADTAAVVESARGADLVWLESPTNPTMEVADLAAIRSGTEALIVMDNTFATPILQRPIIAGADLVLHSATKFMSGHSDALLGCVVVAPRAARLAEHFEEVRRLHGAVPGTMETWLVLRGLRTLALRVERAQQSARVLATRLQAHPAITRVFYPGLPDDPHHATATRTMDGPGSLLSIELDDAETADRFVAALRIWVFATSLGGVESTLERRRRWAEELRTVPEGLVRLSVGIEHVDDLWTDLEQALGQVQEFSTARAWPIATSAR